MHERIERPGRLLTARWGRKRGNGCGVDFPSLGRLCRRRTPGSSVHIDAGETGRREGTESPMPSMRSPGPRATRHPHRLRRRKVSKSKRVRRLGSWIRAGANPSYLPMDPTSLHPQFSRNSERSPTWRCTPPLVSLPAQYRDDAQESLASFPEWFGPFSTAARMWSSRWKKAGNTDVYIITSKSRVRRLTTDRLSTPRRRFRPTDSQIRLQFDRSGIAQLYVIERRPRG